MPNMIRLACVAIAAAAVSPTTVTAVALGPGGLAPATQESAAAAQEIDETGDGGPRIPKRQRCPLPEEV